jgi:hypothetical protein
MKKYKHLENVLQIVTPITQTEGWLKSRTPNKMTEEKFLIVVTGIFQELIRCYN